MNDDYKPRIDLFFSLTDFNAVKMALNPCLCIPLRKGVKILATVDAGFNIIIFVISVYGLIAALLHNEEESSTGKRKAQSMVIIIGTVLVLTTLQFFLAKRLRSGAENEDLRSCRFWWFSTAAIFAIYIIMLVSSRPSETFQGIELVLFLGITLYKVFGIAVVVAYTKLLTKNDQLEIQPTVPPRQPGPIHPTAHVYTVDLPPSYFEIQNETEDAEPPPPYSTELVTVLQSIDVKSNV